MRGLKILGAIVVGLLACLALAFVVARFHDGPLAIIPGGPLISGTLVPTPVTDWSFAADVDTIELELEDSGRSRTTWLLVREGHAYIPCSLGFPPGKSWHLSADVDGRATIRVNGKRYPVSLTRIDSPPVEANLMKIVAAKYGGGPPSDAGVWFFEVESRSR